jgi:predicted AAA+ superfamily ATPase
MSIILRFFDQPEGSYFLFGPRGTGKSTWLRQTYPEAAWIDLLDPESERKYSARPERLKGFVDANRRKGLIIIDEIQKVPTLLTVVHKQMEEDTSVRFILTGSSARKLKQSGVDLLAGRAVRKQMHPFMAAEMGTLFNLEKNIKVGMVPLVVTAAQPEETLKSYIDLYVQQEVKIEGLVRHLDDFNRFLEIVSFSHGNVLSVASIARECVASRNTVESYISILEDLLIAVRIPVFSKRAKRALVSHRKFFFFDCGVFRSLRPTGPLDSREEVDGPALEGLVLQHLRAWIDFSGSSMRIYFWRTRAGNEVDFVLYGDDGFFAFEVKNSIIIRKSDYSGLRAFKQDYPEAQTILLYRGEEMIEQEGILNVPVDVFLRYLYSKVHQTQLSFLIPSTD